LDQTSAVVEFVGAFESNDGAEGEGGKPAVVDEAKLFNGEKFGVGIPKDGNAPNGDIDGKPNGRPQGRLLKLEARSSCCFFCHRFFAIAHGRCYC
jgi:hypothetical protein